MITTTRDIIRIDKTIYKLPIYAGGFPDAGDLTPLSARIGVLNHTGPEPGSEGMAKGRDAQHPTRTPPSYRDSRTAAHLTALKEIAQSLA
jgi:hypothetical protein